MKEQQPQPTSVQPQTSIFDVLAQSPALFDIIAGVGAVPDDVPMFGPNLDGLQHNYERGTTDTLAIAEPDEPAPSTDPHRMRSGLNYYGFGESSSVRVEPGQWEGGMTFTEQQQYARQREREREAAAQQQQWWDSGAAEFYLADGH